MARTSGGLIKRNHQFTQDQIDRLATFAGEKRLSEAAAVRELIDLGLKVAERRKQLANVDGMVVDLVAREVA